MDIVPARQKPPTETLFETMTRVVISNGGNRTLLQRREADLRPGLEVPECFRDSPNVIIEFGNISLDGGNILLHRPHVCFDRSEPDDDLLHICFDGSKLGSCGFLFFCKRLQIQLNPIHAVDDGLQELSV